MNAKIFVDSNVWIYLFGQDQGKKEVALHLLSQNPIISTQVIAENINVCLRKLNLPFTVVEQHASNLSENCVVVVIQPATILAALHIHHRYQYSFYDSLIVAAALENDCSMLYSEDLQHEQVIEGTLQIINPFVKGTV